MKSRFFRRPLATLAFVATIFLATAAGVAIISLTIDYSFRPLPYPAPKRIVALWDKSSAAPIIPLSIPDLADIRAATGQFFENLGGFFPTTWWVRDEKGSLRVPVCGLQVAAFEALRPKIVLGRGPRAGDRPAAAGTAAPAWISERLWESRYGRNPGIIGKRLAISPLPTVPSASSSHFRVVGVIGAGVNFPIPLTSQPAAVWFVQSSSVAGTARGFPALLGIGRLKSAVSLKQAQAAVAAVGARLARQYRVDRGTRPVLVRLQDRAQAPARRVMVLLALGVVLLILLACANLSILMLGEADRRHAELSVRTALGASPLQLWAEIAGEKLPLCALSLLAGGALSWPLLTFLAHLASETGIDRTFSQPPRPSLAIFAVIAASLLAATVAWCAVIARSARPGDAHDLASSAARLGGRGQALVLSLQGFVAVVLVSLTISTVAAYSQRNRAELGPAPARTFLVNVEPRTGAAMSDSQAAGLDQKILRRFSLLSGARSTALAYPFPPPAYPHPFWRAGAAAESYGQTTNPIAVSRRFFTTLGIPILAGRRFDATDSPAAQPAAIINLAMAREGWPTPEQAVGSFISLDPHSKNPLKIVGVAANFSGYWTHGSAVPMVYRPQSQLPSGGGVVILRGPRALPVSVLNHLLAGISPALAAGQAATMQSRWASTLTAPRARSWGMALLAFLALALSAQGIYLVAAANAAARRQEIAVRLALGARAMPLATRVLRRALLAVTIGIGGGMVADLALLPALHQQLGAATSSTWAPELGAAVLLLAVAAVGAAGPALAAVRLAPAELFRES